MSDIPEEYREPIYIREQIERIDRLREEARRFTAEQHKLMAEREKLTAGGPQFGRERFLAPWLAIVGLIGGIITVANLVAHWGARCD